jgi:hypothetical protein
MNMKLSELINQIITEWSYRVENGMPDATNPTHLIHLGIVLKEMGLSHIKQPLIENLLMEKGKTPDANVAEAESNFTNPALNKSIKYKNDKGEDAEGIVGNLLRLPKEHPGRVAAEKTLPADGTPERDKVNQDLGGQNQPGGAEKPKDAKGGEEAPKEDPAKAAAAMFDPKADPAMAARMDKEKEVQAQIAKDAEKAQADFKAQAQKAQDDFKAQSDKAQSDFKAQAGDKVQKAKAKGYDFYKLSLNADELKAEEDKERNAVADAKAAGDEKGAEAAALKYTQTRIARAKKEGDKEAEQMWSDEYVSKRGEYENKYGEQPEDEFDLSKDKAKSDSNEFKPIDSKDVAKEMPQADPETFAGGSDIPDGVKPEQLEKFNTDIQKVAKQVADAKAKGEPAPNINLCDVTVPGTNLYCDDNLGIPRDEMPQFKGTAQPGSRAAGMDVDASGEVDTEPVFKEMLAQKGIKTLQTQIPADKLKATQKDLVGAKVVGMMGALEKDPNHPKITAPIYVSRDGHVIDGHHRWAAVVAYNAANPDKQIQMKTTVLDQDIKDAIPMANKFAEDMGIAAKKADANKEEPQKVTSAPKVTEKIKKKIENWTEKEKAFFDRNEGAPGSEMRRSLGQALKDKAAGALKAIKKGFKHEVEEFKEAGKGVQNFFSGKPLSKHEQKALKAVAFKVVTTAVFGAALGGTAHGAAYFAKHVAMEFIPHVVGETLLKGVAKAAVFADAEGEAETDANMIKFTELIAKGLEEMEITPEMMEQMVDSYNEKKERGEIDGDTTTTGVKAEHLHLVDELMMEMIYGFIDEIKPKSKKFQAISKQSGKVSDFDSQDARDAAVKKGTHKDVDSSNKTSKQPKPQSALATDKGVQSRVDREKAALDKIQKDTTPSVQTPKRKGGSLDDLLNSIPDKGKVADLKTKVNRSKDNILNYFKKESKNKKNPHSVELGKVSVIMEKIFNGEKLNSSEKKTAARWIRIAEPTEASPDTAKFYIAKEPNNFKNRVKEETGGRGSSTAVFGAFRKHMEDGGLTQISTSTFGGKKSTANQTFVDENGKTKLLKTKKGENIASVQKDVSGKVSAITIGGLNIKKMDTNERGISDEERELRKRNNRNVNEYASKIEAGDLDFIDMDNGVVPDSPQNRVIVIKEAIGGMAKRFKDLADKYYIADEETLGLIQTLADFSKKDPNKNPQQWANEFQGIFSDIANHEGEPSLKEGWANFAEVYAAIVEMHDDGKGTQNGRCVLLPQSTTLETVDIITIADGTNERKIVTLDGRSVKKGVGGASALTSKTKKSTYKNDKDGKKAEAITKLSESHSTIYELGLDTNIKEHIAHQKKYKEDIIAKAKALGVSDNFVKNVQNRLSDPSKCPKPLPKDNPCGAAHNSITEAINTLIKKRDEKGLPTDESTMQKIRMRLESYYHYTFLSHEAYNHNVDVQDFSNDSILSQKGDTGGAALARNRKISINSSNGVSILAYPKPEFNVGFSLDGRSSNPGAGRFHNEEKRK